MKRALTALALAATAGMASATLLTNGGFEAPDASAGDVPGAPTGWSGFNDPGTQNATQQFALSGLQSFKLFGPFDFVGGGTGIVQSVPAAPGEIYNGSIWALNSSADALQGADFFVYKIEFLNASGGLAAGGLLGVDVFESVQFTAASAQDVWTELGVGTAPAPAGTAAVQVVAVKVQLGDPQFNGGSVFLDDATLNLVPAPGTAALIGVAGLAATRRRRA